MTLNVTIRVCGEGCPSGSVLQQAKAIGIEGASLSLEQSRGAFGVG